MTHDPTARDPQAIDTIEPIDPDIEFTADFLAHALTPERESEFRRRFAEDEPFFAKVAPIISAWRLNASYEDLIARPADSFPLVDPFTLAERAATRRRLERDARNAQLRRRLAKWGSIAAGIAVLVSYPSWFAYRAFKPVALDVAVPTLALASPTPPGFALPGAANPSVRSGRPSTLGGAPGDTAITVSGAKLWFLQQVGTEYVAPDSAPRLLELKNGGRILLGPGARVAYGSATPFIPGSADLYIEGEVALELVDTRPSALVSVHSAAGYAVVGAGSYAFRCEARCSSLAVTVAAGSAELYRDASGPRGVVIGAGGFGLAYRYDPPLEVGAASAVGFPAVQPAIRR